MRFVVVLALAVGCTGGSDTEPQPALDAPTQQAIDAGVDGAPAPACTGAAYEACTDNTQCTSMQCRLFMQDGIQVCTASCDANTPCPDFAGQPVTCNMQGRCKPPAAIACMR